jgi:hypothetical protein
MARQRNKPVGKRFKTRVVSSSGAKVKSQRGFSKSRNSSSSSKKPSKPTGEGFFKKTLSQQQEEYKNSSPEKRKQLMQDIRKQFSNQQEANRFVTAVVTGEPLGARTVVEITPKKPETIDLKSSPFPQFQAGTIENLQNKALTGQTMSPFEIRRLQQFNDRRGKQITQEQNRILRTAPREIVRGGTEVAKELFTFGRDVVKGAYNYGFNASSRANTNGTSVVSVFSSDVKKLARGTVDVGEFVIKNPGKTAAIVGSVAALSGRSYEKALMDNPIKTLTKSVLYLFPGTVLKGIGKATGTSKLFANIGTGTRYTKNTYTSKTSITTGKIRVTGKIEGLRKLDSKKFSSSYTLNYNPKTKEFTGNIKTTIGKKTTSQKLRFKDEGAFWLEAGTGQKLVKAKLPITSKSVKIKETTITPKTRELVTVGDASAFKQTSEVKNVITSIINNVKKTTTKISKVTQIIDPKTSKVAKVLSKRLSTQLKTQKKAFKPTIAGDEKKQLEAFLKSVNYDKALINGLDKRTRIARALGLRKESSQVKAIMQVVDKNGKVKTQFTKGTVTVKGQVTTGRPLKPKKPKVKTIKTTLRKNKKGQISLGESKGVQTLNINKKGVVTKDYIRIPLVSPKLPAIKVKGARLSSNIVRLQKGLKEIARLQERLNSKDTVTSRDIQQLNRQIKEVKQDVVKINDQVKILDKAQTQTTKSSQKTVSKSKSRLTSTPSRLKTPPKTPAKPKRVPTINLSFKSKLKKGEKLLFDVLYKSKGKVRSLGVKLPENKALKRAKSLIDNTTSRSMELKIIDKGKVKDIKKESLSKFTQRKTPKTLKIVEKPKYSIDTRGEKRGLTVAKRLRKSKKANIGNVFAVIISLFMFFVLYPVIQAILTNASAEAPSDEISFLISAVTWVILFGILKFAFNLGGE